MFKSSRFLDLVHWPVNVQLASVTNNLREVWLNCTRLCNKYIYWLNRNKKCYLMIMSVNYSCTARGFNCAPRSLRDRRGVSGFSSNKFPSDESKFLFPLDIIPSAIFLWSIPVAALSKAWVCVSPLDETAGSNPAGSMEVCCVLWVRRTYNRSNSNAEESYRVWCVWVWCVWVWCVWVWCVWVWCVWVWSRNLNNEEGYPAIK